MSSSDTENESDDERNEEVLLSLEASAVEEDISVLMELYNIDAYRWLLNATEQSMVTAIMEPTFYKDVSIVDFMTEHEYRDFKRAIDDHVKACIPCNASPFMQTLIHFVTDVFHACNREPTVRSFDKFLTQLCMQNPRMIRVPKRPRKAPKAPLIFHRNSVRQLQYVSESKDDRNTEDNN